MPQFRFILQMVDYSAAIPFRYKFIISQNHTPPFFRLIAPGRVYRRDHDMTHTPMFNQIEGLLISENSSLQISKSLLHSILKQS